MLCVLGRFLNIFYFFLFYLLGLSKYYELYFGLFVALNFLGGLLIILTETNIFGEITRK